MINLGFENALRRLLRFPPILEGLCGPSSRCIFPHSSANEAARLVRHDPLALVGAARDMVTRGARGSVIHLIDDLLLHPPHTEEAKDFALFLASNPSLLTPDSTTWIPAGRGARDRYLWQTLQSVFLVLKGVQCAIRGGFYKRARSCLLQADSRVTSLPHVGHDSYKTARALIQANISLLLGRLQQVTSLPVPSLQHLAEAETRFSDAMKQESPPLLRLLTVRSMMEITDRLGAARELFDILPPPGSPGWRHIADHPTDTVLGHHGEPYYYYLAARLSVAENDLAAARFHLNRSRQHTVAITHHGEPDPIRLGFLALLEAETDLRTRPPHFDLARQRVLTARDAFRAAKFVPGEFLATRKDVQINTDADSLPTLRQRRLKGVRILAELGGVELFEVQARHELAQAYLAIGRLDAASREVEHITALLKEGDLQSKACPDSLPALKALRTAVADSLTNAVEDRARWGVSHYADTEAQFVDSMVATPALPILTCGPPLSGHILLVQRIHRSRPPSGRLIQITSLGQRDMILRSVATAIRHGDTILLINPASADGTLQEDLAGALAEAFNHPSGVARLYMVEQGSLAQTLSRVHPKLLAYVHATARFEAMPLEERPEDMLALARGFLVQHLARSNHLGVPSQFTFTGDACRHLYNSANVLNVEPLYDSMGWLASHLMAVDCIYASSGAARVTHEALLKYGIGFPGATRARVGMMSDTSIPAGEAIIRTLGKRILAPPVADVKSLAGLYSGNFSRLAVDVRNLAGYSRSYLVERWGATGSMNIWREEGGRQRRLVKKN